MSRILKYGVPFREFCAGIRKAKAQLGKGDTTSRTDYADYRDFFDAYWGDLQTAYASGYTWQRLGRDFYLTRNGHRAGFLDEGHRGAEAAAALDRLTNAAHVYGSTE